MHQLIIAYLIIGAMGVLAYIIAMHGKENYKKMKQQKNHE
jgi:Flp pilus assembly protein TadB